MLPSKTWLFSLLFTACAGLPAESPRAHTTAFTAPHPSTPARIGPPNSRGTSFRRIDRATPTPGPIALY